MLNINYLQIDIVIKICEKFGNNVKEISEGWTNARKVFHMYDFLSDILREEIEKKFSEIGVLE